MDDIGREHPSSVESAPDRPSRPDPGRKRGHHAEPLEVRVEFVVLDGPAGKALAARQAAVMHKVLQWVADHPKTENADSRPDSSDER